MPDLPGNINPGTWTFRFPEELFYGRVLSTSEIMCTDTRESAVCLFYMMFDSLEAASKATELGLLQDRNILN